MEGPSPRAWSVQSAELPIFGVHLNVAVFASNETDASRVRAAASGYNSKALWRVAGVPVAGSTNATSTSLVVKLKDVDPVVRNANTMVGGVGFSGVRYTAAIE
jgi:hypothetical protein